MPSLCVTLTYNGQMQFLALQHLFQFWISRQCKGVCDFPSSAGRLIEEKKKQIINNCQKRCRVEGNKVVMKLGRVLTFQTAVLPRTIFFLSFSIIHSFPLFHIIIMKIHIPKIQHSQEGRIKQKKKFIPPISKCRREQKGAQARGTPARVILGQCQGAIRDTGTRPYPFPPHRLLLAKGHFPTCSR